MRNYEKSAFHPGAYVTWDAHGYAFRVFRDHAAKGWRAMPAHGAHKQDTRYFFTRTLRECVEKVGADARFASDAEATQCD